MLTILIAPSAYETLSADEASAAIESGIRRPLPDARILTAPFAGDGDGLSRALHEADVVFTADGVSGSATSADGMPAEVRRRTRLSGVPMISLAGTTPTGTRGGAARFLADAADRAVRVLLVGHRLRDAGTEATTC